MTEEENITELLERTRHEITRMFGELDELSGTMEKQIQEHTEMSFAVLLVTALKTESDTLCLDAIPDEMMCVRYLREQSACGEIVIPFKKAFWDHCLDSNGHLIIHWMLESPEGKRHTRIHSQLNSEATMQITIERVIS